MTERIVLIFLVRPHSEFFILYSSFCIPPRQTLRFPPPHTISHTDPMLPDTLISTAGEILGAPVLATIPLLGGYTPQRSLRLVLDGWQALLLEDLGDAGRVPPWSDRSIDLVAAGMAEMHRATLGTPRPSHAAAPSIPSRLVETRRSFIVTVAPWFADFCGARRMPT
jgi:hypothetical protein